MPFNLARFFRRLLTYGMLLILALVLFLYGIDMYQSVEQSYQYDYLYYNMKMSTNTTVVFEEASQFVYTAVNETAEDEFKTTSMSLYAPNASLPYTLHMEVPYEIRELEGAGITVIDEPSYNSSLSRTSFSLISDWEFIEFWFEWRVLVQISYDEYRYLIPYSPLLLNCSIEVFFFEIYTVPGTFLELAKTFPIPDNIVSQYGEYPRFRWIFYELQESPIYYWDEPYWEISTIQAVFRSPDKSSEKEGLILRSGIFLGLGTGVLTEIFLIAAKEEHAFSLIAGFLKILFSRLRGHKQAEKRPNG